MLFTWVHAAAGLSQAKRSAARLNLALLQQFAPPLMAPASILTNPAVC
jgi:hypothetical protein